MTRQHVKWIIGSLIVVVPWSLVLGGILLLMLPARCAHVSQVSTRRDASGISEVIGKSAAALQCAADAAESAVMKQAYTVFGRP